MPWLTQVEAPRPTQVEAPRPAPALNHSHVASEDAKPKPEAAWPKIIEGKLNKWYSEVALLEQESVVVPGQTIDKLREAAGKAAGAAVTLTRFVRFERGEGLDKGQSDFAAEVAKMAGG